MATLEDFYPPVGGISSYRDIDYTWSVPASPINYADTTGFTIVNNMAELDVALTGGNYQVYLNNGTYDFGDASTYAYTIPQTATFHLRGQSQAGVILTCDSSITDRFLFGVSLNPNLSATFTGVYNALLDTVISTADAQGLGAVAGDYVMFSVACMGTDTNTMLRKIIDVQPTTITLEEPIPCDLEDGINNSLTIVKASEVHDGNITIENITIQEDINSGNEWFDGQGWVKNAVVNDFTWHHRTTGGDGDFWADNACDNVVFNRCTFYADTWDVNREGPEIPNHSVLNQCLFQYLHVRYGGEGKHFYDCYFENAPIYEEGGHYEKCVFDTTTPAIRYFENNNSNDLLYTISDCRYINVERWQIQACESQLGVQNTFSLLHTNGATTSVNGHVIMTHYISFNSTTQQIVAFGGGGNNQFNITHTNGSTHFLWQGSTIADTTMYVFYKHLY